MVEQASLAQRLWVLREQMRKKAAAAATALKLTGAVLVLGGIVDGGQMLLGSDALAGPWAYNGDTPYFLAAAALMLLPIAAGCVILATCSRLFPYYYQLALRRNAHSGAALLFAAEERLQQLMPYLPGRFWGAAPAKPAFKTLAERLEFCAFHYEGLRQLMRNPERRPRGVTLDERAREIAQYSNDGLVVVCCLFGRMIFVVLSLLYAPRIIRAHANLAALVDFMLEAPRADPGILPPPPPGEPQGWWARTSAPWSTPPLSNSALW
jgi:hypothetical protein